MIVWRDDTAGLLLQLMNLRRAWQTEQDGDAVWLTHGGTKTREAVLRPCVDPVSEAGIAGFK